MLLGDLEGPTARIDRAGVINSLDHSWCLEWGVGSEDRWRVAHRERGVRQTRIDDTPVFETRLRVPGGDVVQRVAATNNGVHRDLMIEFENDSATAVVVAVAARLSGMATVSVDGVCLDATDWLSSSGQIGATVAVDGDVWATVEAEPSADVATISGSPIEVALLVPLPHRQRTTFLLGPGSATTTAAPTPDQVAAGWRSVVSNGLTIEGPTRDLEQAWRRIVCDLVLIAGTTDPAEAAEAAWWLDRAGLHEEADRARATLVAAVLDNDVEGAGAAAGLRALASRELLMKERSGLDELAGPLTAAAGRLIDRATLLHVAAALDLTSPGAAADARRLAEAAAISRWETSADAARAASTVIEKLVAFADRPGEIILVPGLSADWLGRSLDVRNLITEAGVFSFSVRWHGDRPALLWELTDPSTDVKFVLSAPLLDPAWSSTEINGEALLSTPQMH